MSTEAITATWETEDCADHAGHIDNACPTCVLVEKIRGGTVAATAGHESVLARDLGAIRASLDAPGGTIEIEDHERTAGVRAWVTAITIAGTDYDPDDDYDQARVREVLAGGAGTVPTAEMLRTVAALTDGALLLHDDGTWEARSLVRRADESAEEYAAALCRVVVEAVSMWDGDWTYGADGTDPYDELARSIHEMRYATANAIAERLAELREGRP